MKLLFTALCFILIVQSYAQTGNFTKNAIYKSFEEFRNNTPSITGIDILFEQTKEEGWKVKYRFMDGSEKKLTGRFWAFADSTDLFIWYKGHFGKVIEFGKVWIFRFYFEEHATVNITGTIRTVPGEQETYILDYATGNITELKLKTVKKVLQADSELFKQFSKESEYNQERDMLTYVRQFNQRNRL